MSRAGDVAGDRSIKSSEYSGGDGDDVRRTPSLSAPGASADNLPLYGQQCRPPPAVAIDVSSEQRAIFRHPVSHVRPVGTTRRQFPGSFVRLAIHQVCRQRWSRSFRGKIDTVTIHKHRAGDRDIDKLHHVTATTRTAEQR